MRHTAAPGCTAGRWSRWPGSGRVGRSGNRRVPHVRRDRGGVGSGLAPGRGVDGHRRRAAVERLGVERLDVLALDPVVADPDVLAVGGGGAAVVHQVVEGGARLHLAGRGSRRRGRHGRAREVRWRSGWPPWRRRACPAEPGRTGRHWSGRETAVAAGHRGVDGTDAGQRGERGRDRGGDDLDIPPLGEAAVAGADDMVVRRDRHVGHARRRRVTRQGRRRSGRGRWSAGGRCRWPSRCTGWAADWRTAEPGCRGCRCAWCSRVMVPLPADVPDWGWADGPAPASQPVRWPQASRAGVAVVVLAVEQVDIGPVVVAVGLADLATGGASLPQLYCSGSMVVPLSPLGAGSCAAWVVARSRRRWRRLERQSEEHCDAPRLPAQSPCDHVVEAGGIVRSRESPFTDGNVGTCRPRRAAACSPRSCDRLHDGSRRRATHLFGPIERRRMTDQDPALTCARGAGWRVPRSVGAGPVVAETGVELAPHPPRNRPGPSPRGVRCSTAEGRAVPSTPAGCDP